MKRYALHLLTVLAAGLSLLLAGFWLKPDGSVRNGTWVPPEPVLNDYQAMLPVLPPIGSADTTRFVAMLDRPIFSATRRPPPPPPPPESVQAPPPDNLSTARLSGVFQGEGVGGVIMLIGGKQRRAQINDAVEGWTLRSIQGRTVTFGRGAQQRVLTLERALLQTAGAESASTPASGRATPVTRGARPVQRGQVSVPAVPVAASPTPAAVAPSSPPAAAAAAPRAATAPAPGRTGDAPAPSAEPTFGGR